MISVLSTIFLLQSYGVSCSVKATNICGDVNDDGNVDLSDVTYISQYLRTQNDSINIKNADVDRNAVIDVNDIKVLQAYVMRGISSIPYNEDGNYFTYDDYSVPADNSRRYRKYNCITGNVTQYTLPVSSLSALSLDIDDRIIDSSEEATSIVRVEYTYPDGSNKSATGFIVDDHIVATAAHCLCNPNTGEFCTNVKVRPFYANGTSFGESYSAKELHVSRDYISENRDTTVDDRNSDHDYGLIYLEHDMSGFGIIPLGISTLNFENTGARVFVSGYPGTVAGNEQGLIARFYGSGNILSTSTDKLLHYDVFTSSGDSGGPVFLEYTLGTQTFRSAIGINVFGTPTYNRGPRVSKQLLRFYYNNPYVG